MAFVQIMELSTSKPDALMELDAQWRAGGPQLAHRAGAAHEDRWVPGQRILHAPRAPDQERGAGREDPGTLKLADRAVDVRKQERERGTLG